MILELYVKRREGEKYEKRFRRKKNKNKQNKLSLPWKFYASYKNGRKIANIQLYVFVYGPSISSGSKNNRNVLQFF